jgi:DNA polymerase III epsilon subunit-like protein
MIILDIEASGLDSERASILSVGALDLANPTNQFYDECCVWDGAHINDDALVVNGFTKEEATDPNKKTEAELVRAFMAWSEEIGNRTLAGQNPSFDRDFLRMACKRAGIDWTLAHRTLDSHTIAWMHMTKRGINPPLENRRSALNLDAILNYCGIPEEPKPHNALTGAMSHAEVISRMLYDEPLLEDFNIFPIPWKQKPS